MLLAFQFFIRLPFYFENSTLVQVLTKTEPNTLACIGYYVRTTYQFSVFARTQTNVDLLGLWLKGIFAMMISEF